MSSFDNFNLKIPLVILKALQGLLTATGIYSGRMGFLCGESLAIMLAYVTQAQPSIGPSALVEKFLQVIFALPRELAGFLCPAVLCLNFVHKLSLRSIALRIQFTEHLVSVSTDVWTLALA